MNVPQADHCSGCGRELGLEPILEPGQPCCPVCAVALQVHAAGPGRLFDCPSCGAQFVEHALLKDLLERRETYALGMSRTPRPSTGGEQPIRYVKCPACGDLMNRKNFGGSSGIVVDVCAKHGVWFDQGELPRIMKFVEDGGLARARAREEERARRRDAERRAREAADGVRLGAIAGDTGSFVDDLERAGHALLSYVIHALKR
jgi:Zn-finger nucleic acid-binding protein